MVFCWNFLNSVPTSSPVQSTTEINNPSLTHHSQKCWKCAILQEICHRLWQIDCFLQMLIRWCAQEGAPSKDLGIFWQFQWGAGSGGVLDTARYGVDIWMLVSKETYPKIAELFKLCCFFGMLFYPDGVVLIRPGRLLKKGVVHRCPELRFWDHLGPWFWAHDQPLVASAHSFATESSGWTSWSNVLVDATSPTKIHLIEAVPNSIRSQNRKQVELLQLPR